MDAARDGLDRKGLTARHAIDLEAFCVACDDRADALALTELDGGDMGGQLFAKLDQLLVLQDLVFDPLPQLLDALSDDNRSGSDEVTGRVHPPMQDAEHENRFADTQASSITRLG
jgi:hypothetical protein